MSLLSRPPALGLGVLAGVVGSGEKQGERKEHPTVSQDTWLAKILLSHQFLNHNRNNLVIWNGTDRVDSWRVEESK